METSRATTKVELMNAYTFNMRLHKQLLEHIARQMILSDVKSFVNITRNLYLPPAITDRYKDDIHGILTALETVNCIRIGEYTTLCDILKVAHLTRLSEDVAKMGKEIKVQPEDDVLQSLENGNTLKSLVTEDHRQYMGYTHQVYASERWQVTCRRKEHLFVRTTSYKEALRTLKDNKSVLILGNSGEGKTCNLQKLSLEMAKEGYLTILVQSPSEINDYFLHDRKVLLVFDQPFGGVCRIPSKVEEWSQFNQLYFENFLNTGMILLAFACSRLVWSDCKAQLEDMSVFENIVEVSSEKLTFEEKFEMLTKCSDEKELALPKKVMKQICVADTIAFPKCCCLMKCLNSGNIDYDLIINEFLHPWGYLRKQLRHMRTTSDGRWKYCVLVLVVLHGGNLFLGRMNLNKIDNKMMATMKKVVRICCRTRKIDFDALCTGAKSLVGSYLRIKCTEDEQCYEFLHDSILGAVALEFGQANTDLILEHCDPTFCVQMCRPAGHAHSDDSSVIELPKDTYRKFVQILTDQVLDETNWSVFSTVSGVTLQKEWIAYMETLDTSRLDSFLAKEDNSGEILYHAAAAGASDLMHFLVSRGARCSPSLSLHPFVAFASGGHVSFVDKFLRAVRTNTASSVREIEVQSSCRVGAPSNAPTAELVISDIIRCSDDILHPNVFSDLLRYALNHSSSRGQTNVVRLLLDRNVSLDMVSEAFTFAAAFGQLDIVDLFLCKNITGKAFRVALNRASSNGHINVVKKLLHANLSHEVMGSALVESSKSGQVEVIRLLLSRNIPKCTVGEALIAASVWHQNEVVDIQLNYGISQEVLVTALYETSWRGDTRTVKQLLRYDAPVEYLGGMLSEAAGWGRLDVVELFLQFDVSRQDLANALVEASRQGQLPVVCYLSKHNLSEEARSVAMLKALEYDNLDIVESLLLRGVPQTTRDDALVIAAGKGYMDFVFSLLNNFEISTKSIGDAISKALNNRHLSMVHYLLQHDPPPSALSSVLKEASCCGYMDIVEAVLRFNLPMKVIGDSLVRACFTDLPEIVELLLQKELSDVWLCKALEEAVKYRRTKVLPCLLQLMIPSSELARSMSEAGRRGFEDVVQLFLEHDQPRKAINECLIAATWGGQSAIVELLLEENPSRGTMGQALCEASRRNHIEISQRLVLKNIPKSFMYKAMLEATWMGNLDILQSIQEQTDACGSTDLSVRLLTAALSKGHVHISRHLLENGVFSDVLAKVVRGVLQTGDHDLLETYIYHNPPPEALGIVLDTASWEGNCRILKLAVKSDLSSSFWGKSLWNASSRGHVDIVKILVEEIQLSTRCISDALVQASRHGHLEIAKMLLNIHLSAFNTGKALREASTNGYVDIVLLLLDHCRDVEERDKALLQASWMGNAYILHELMPGSSKDILAKALNYAAWRGQIVSVKLLLEKGFPTDVLGEATILASWRGHITIVELLLERGIPEQAMLQTISQMTCHRPKIHINMQ